MKPEQIVSLSQTQERLIDVFLQESKGNDWPTMETKEGRGDLVWFKKNAFATLQIVGKVQSILVTEATLRNSAKGEESGDLDEQNELEAKEAEAVAAKILKRHGLKAL